MFKVHYIIHMYTKEHILLVVKIINKPQTTSEFKKQNQTHTEPRSINTHLDNRRSAHSLEEKKQKETPGHTYGKLI